MPAFDAKRSWCWFRVTDVTEYRRGFPKLFRLDVRGFYDLGPLLGFFGDKLAEVGGRSREYGAAEVGNEACPERRVCETRIDRAV